MNTVRNRKQRRCLWPVTMLVSTLVLLSAAPLAAQDEHNYLMDKPTTLPASQTPGWHPMLKINLNLATGHSYHVVGAPDGWTFNFGFMLNSGLDYRHPEGHVWTSTLTYQLGFSRSPAINKFLKSQDLLEFNTAYLYYIPSVPWLGPYAKFLLRTSPFDGWDVRAADLILKKLNPDGTEMMTRPVPAEEKIALTKAWSPTTLRESIGVFAEPVDKEAFKLTFQLGVGAWETFVRDGFTLADDSLTPELEIKAMQDSIELGGELAIIMSGVYKKFITYKVKAAFMYPFYYTVDTDLSGIDLMNVEFDVLVGVKLTTWASLEYVLKAYRLPLVVDDWQVQNGLLLSITADFF